MPRSGRSPSRSTATAWRWLWTIVLIPVPDVRTCCSWSRTTQPRSFASLRLGVFASKTLFRVTSLRSTFSGWRPGEDRFLPCGRREYPRHGSDNWREQEHDCEATPRAWRGLLCVSGQSLCEPQVQADSSGRNLVVHRIEGKEHERRKERSWLGRLLDVDGDLRGFKTHPVLVRWNARRRCSVSFHSRFEGTPRQPRATNERRTQGVSQCR